MRLSLHPKEAKTAVTRFGGKQAATIYRRVFKHLLNFTLLGKKQSSHVRKVCHTDTVLLHDRYRGYQRE